MSNIKQLKKKLRKLIREYLLGKAERNEAGLCFCPLKGKFYPEEVMQVAHYIDRANMCLTYEERNLLLCSRHSNVWDAGKASEKGYKSKHHEDFAKYIGPEEVAYLESRAHDLCWLQEEDIERYIDYYKQKINET